MKKQPMRKCIVTQEQHPKSDLIRVVLTPEGQVELDLDGRKNGRGAYLKRDKEVILRAKEKALLNRSLRTNVPVGIYEELEKYVR